jgi:hypothetical protein
LHPSNSYLLVCSVTPHALANAYRLGLVGTLLFILREHSHHERATAVLHMRLRIREQFRDVRNNGLVGKALWNFIDSLMGPTGLKILSTNKTYAIAPPSSQRKRKKGADDDEDEEYHPSPVHVRTLNQGAKTRGRRRVE